jgi:predicted enzyme related to lactoylglutathione lyase
LPLVEDGPYALVFDANGIMLRISPVGNVTCAPYTVLGWEVADIQEAIEQLAARGIQPERFDGIPLNEQGVCAFPDGTRVVWFKDPDGHVLSLTQFKRRPGAQTSEPAAPRFKGAFPISGDINALPVKDLGPAIAFYTRVLGFTVEARETDCATLRRDDAVIGIAKNDADPEQASCYFAVENVEALHAELKAAGIEPSKLTPSEHDGRALTIFFAKEPYGVCFCFGAPRS